jgi:2-haloacid dehalogenase
MTRTQNVTADTAAGRINPKYPWNCEEPALLVFDVNEKLIDLESINALFERLFGDRRAMREWLTHLIMYSITVTLSGLYKDFFLSMKRASSNARQHSRRPSETFRH